MPPARPQLRLAVADHQAFDDLQLLHEQDWTLGQLLEAAPAHSFLDQPLDPRFLQLKLSSLRLILVPSYPSPADEKQAPPPPAEVVMTVEQPLTEDHALPTAIGHPEKLGERAAVLIAHEAEIDRAAAYLERGLSVLIQCEKLLVEHLIDAIAHRSNRPRIVIKADSGVEESPLGLPSAGRRSALLASLEREVNNEDERVTVVVPHLDLLAGGRDASISSEARELTDVLYERSTRVLLAFVDPSLTLPEVLADRFAVRLSMDVLPREVRAENGGRIPIGQALVRREEAELFRDFDPIALYKNIAGMNAVRLRHGMRFAYHQHQGQERVPQFADLLQELAVFKAHTSNSFEVPHVPFSRIGGYQSVKDELQRALRIINGAAAGLSDLPDQLRQDLVPRAFIFHGPPGTGKTLFAKAVASELDATILVVSGPEVTDMYVGESERKVRELFAEARRNAPSVLVFDEFDSIAAKRTGRDDGGSRAGNAVVAQLLTELDGFRPEVPVLIIGTTNRIDIVDDALLRPSRFRPIKIDLPDEEAREAIARVHGTAFLRQPPSDRLLKDLARATKGMNGDEIRSIFRDARADELVGERDAQGRARRPDARRLGELVGALRRAQQQRENDQHRPAGRPASGPSFMLLTPPAEPGPITTELTVPRQPAEQVEQ
jgi:transitional endoplasmic reticulum ATPase